MDTFVNINDELIIHIDSYSQLNSNEKSLIENITEKLKLKTVDIEEYVTDTTGNFRVYKAIQSKYKLLFKSEITFKLDYIQNTYRDAAISTDLNQFFITNTAVFSQIKAHEIHRVFNQLYYEFKHEKIIKAAVEFAKFEDVTNIEDFCAAGEFAFMMLVEDAVNNVSASDIDALDELALQLIQTQSKKENYSKMFHSYINQCSTEGLRFSSPFTEVTHFIKHCKQDSSFSKLNLNSPKDFTKYLNDTKPQHKEESIITQEGTHCFHKYKLPLQKIRKRKKINFILQVVEDLSTKEQTIVTVFSPNK